MSESDDHLDPYHYEGVDDELNLPSKEEQEFWKWWTAYYEAHRSNFLPKEKD